MSAIIEVYVCWTLMSFVFYFMINHDRDECFLLENRVSYVKYLYDITKMNIVGCVISAILLYFIFPYIILKSLILSVVWLFHVGRKK